MSFTHIAFADETNYNRGAFPGIALVSMEKTAVSPLRHQYQNILDETRVDEFKWSRLHSAKRRFAALKMIELTLECLQNKQMRLDILTWDIQDKRHRVLKPDRIANLQRMYYHLFRNVLQARWPDTAVWQLCPDEHTAVAWQTLHDYLDNNAIIEFKQTFQINQIVQCDSDKEPFIQLADLFVGMASYSRACYEKIRLWQKEPEAAKESLSHSDLERCQIIHSLNQHCKRKRLGVSLATHKGLRTMNPAKPLNFWWYIPQHDSDKAPQRP